MDVSSFLKSFKASRVPSEYAHQAKDGSSAHNHTTADDAGDALSELDHSSPDSSDTDEWGGGGPGHTDESEDDVLHMGNGGGTRLTGRRRQRHQLSVMLEQDRLGAAAGNHVNSLEEAIERNTLGSLKIMSANVADDELASRARVGGRQASRNTGMDIQACRRRLLQMQSRHGKAAATQREMSSRADADADVLRTQLHLARTRLLRAKQQTAAKAQLWAAKPTDSSAARREESETSAMLDVDDLLSSVGDVSSSSASAVDGVMRSAMMVTSAAAPKSRSGDGDHTKGNHEVVMVAPNDAEGSSSSSSPVMAVTNEPLASAVDLAGAGGSVCGDAPPPAQRTESLDATSSSTAPPATSARKVSLFSRARKIVSSTKDASQ